MANLTAAQIAGVAKGAGFSGSALAKAVAIALAESSGNPSAHNAVPPDDSYGLWQINMYGSMGPARRKQFGLSSNSQLFDPATNAKAAYAISNGGKSFGAWSTYTSGAYLAYLPAANKAAGNPDTAIPANYVQPAGLTDSWDAITGFFEFISDPYTWLRLGMILAGGGLLIFALAGMAGQSGAVANIAGKITDVIPQTRAIKAAAKVA